MIEFRDKEAKRFHAMLDEYITSIFPSKCSFVTSLWSDIQIHVYSHSDNPNTRFGHQHLSSFFYLSGFGIASTKSICDSIQLNHEI